MTTVVHAEAGIHFQHFHQAAPEQSRPDHENQRDRDLRRHDDPANALAALRTRLTPTPAFARGPSRRSTDVARDGGERPEAGGDRRGQEEREHELPEC